MKGSGDTKSLNLSDWKETSEAEYGRLFTIIAPELHPFVEDHAALGKLMDKVRTGYSREVYENALKRIEEELEHHFREEERLILRFLSNHIPADDAGPVFKLKQEHDIIRSRYLEAAQLFAEHNEHSRERLVQKMNMLAYLLKKHIEKEDHYLFPMAGAILTQEEKRSIARELSGGHPSDELEPKE
ncbi:MAG: hemerythrin domain-containing protein [Brevibacillus sp.]|nr:hemerythrin domain-containing protein [Brevibacillus sp.]